MTHHKNKEVETKKKGTAHVLSKSVGKKLIRSSLWKRKGSLHFRSRLHRNCSNRWKSFEKLPDSVPLVIKIKKRLKPDLFWSSQLYLSSRGNSNIAPINSNSTCSLEGSPNPDDVSHSSASLEDFKSDLDDYDSSATELSVSGSDFRWSPQDSKDLICNNFSASLLESDNGIDETLFKREVEVEGENESSISPMILRHKVVFCQRILKMIEDMDKKVNTCAQILGFFKKSVSECVFSETLSDDMEALICLCHDRVCIVMNALATLNEQQIYLVSNEEGRKIWALHNVIICSLQAYKHLQTLKPVEILHNTALSLIMIIGMILMPQSGLGSADTILRMHQICNIQEKLIEKNILSPVCSCRNPFICTMSRTISCPECDIDRLYTDLCGGSESPPCETPNVENGVKGENIFEKLLTEETIQFLDDLVKISPQALNTKLNKHKKDRFLCNPISGLRPCVVHHFSLVCKCFSEKKQPMSPVKTSFHQPGVFDIHPECNPHKTYVNCKNTVVESECSALMEVNFSEPEKADKILQIKTFTSEKNKIGSSDSFSERTGVDSLESVSLRGHFSSECDSFASSVDIVSSQNSENDIPSVTMKNLNALENLNNYQSKASSENVSIRMSSKRFDENESNLSDSDLSKSTIDIDDSDFVKTSLVKADVHAPNDAGERRPPNDNCSDSHAHYYQQKCGIYEQSEGLKESAGEDYFQKKAVSFREPMIEAYHVYKESSESDASHSLCTNVGTLNDQMSSSKPSECAHSNNIRPKRSVLAVQNASQDQTLQRSVTSKKNKNEKVCSMDQHTITVQESSNAVQNENDQVSSVDQHTNTVQESSNVPNEDNEGSSMDQHTIKVRKSSSAVQNKNNKGNQKNEAFVNKVSVEDFPDTEYKSFVADFNSTMNKFGSGSSMKQHTNEAQQSSNVTHVGGKRRSAKVLSKAPEPKHCAAKSKKIKEPNHVGQDSAKMKNYDSEDSWDFYFQPRSKHSNKEESSDKEGKEEESSDKEGNREESSDKEGNKEEPSDKEGNNEDDWTTYLADLQERLLHQISQPAAVSKAKSRKKNF